VSNAIVTSAAVTPHSEEEGASSVSGPSMLDPAQRLCELAQQFASNLSSATRDFAWHVTDEKELAGLAARDLARAKRSAEQAGLGGFLLTLDAASFFPALASLEDRELRKALYEAFYTRASDRGPRAGRFDNTPTLNEMLELRYQLAKRSGFRNFAAMAVSDGVITEPDAAETALIRAHRGTRERAQAELDRVWAFAKEKGAPRGFSNWDLSFYLALWQREKLGFDARQLRDYFTLDASTQGALEVAARLFGVTIARAPAPPSTFSVSAGGALLGTLVLDPGGAGVLLGEERVTQVAGATPTVRIECGFEPPGEPTEPFCLEQGELSTLFRCVGQAVFLLASRGLEPGKAPSRQALLGARVAGYFFETLASDGPTLHGFARHCRSGEPLSEELQEGLRQARAAEQGLRAAMELELELFDLRVHRDHIPAGKATRLRVQVLDIFTQVRREQSVLPASYWTRFANISTPLFVRDEAARLWERSWSKKMASALFEGGEGSLRAFAEPGDLTVVERLTRALGTVPEFGRVS
jgi:oligopeptidase A